MAGTENTRGEEELDLRNDVKGGWQDFLFCMALHLTLPLVPLGLEHWFSGHVEAKSVALTAALYAMAIALSSRNLAFLGLVFVLHALERFNRHVTDRMPFLEY